MPALVILLAALLALSLVLLVSVRNRAVLLSDQNAANENEKKIVYDFLDRIGQNVTSGADVDQTIEMIVTFAQEATKADAAGLFTRDAAGVYRPRVIKGLFPPLYRSAAADKLLAKRKYIADKVMKETFMAGDGVLGAVAKTGKQLLVADAKTDDRIPDVENTGVEINDLIITPLTVRGEITGVLAVVNKTGGERFNAADASIAAAIADQAAVTYDLVKLYKVKAEQQRLEQELALARAFQEILIPNKTPDLEKVAITGFYRSALEVGGDYFDYIPIDERHLGIAVADVSGKGIPGALVMSMVRATLRAEARLSLSPKEVLQRVNDQTAQDTRDSVFITMTYGILDTETGVFRFCRAGHEPILCCSKDCKNVKAYLPEGIALGLVAGETFSLTKEMEINLAVEQSVVLYTDGVIEAVNANGEEYGEKRFHDALASHSGLEPRQIIDEVIGDIEKFTSGLPQHDDITLFIVSWKPTAENVREERLVHATACGG
ncbi:SpoIIE family protein phosphatase [Candidatus Sumerlaeota bacterium]|nr:SpoIIE family protein phosphatase [Candidatus Sumerlaeota bacterium]